jgi:hypothetical protein
VRTFGRGSERKGLGEDKSDTPGPGSYELETTFVGPDLKGYGNLLGRSSSRVSTGSLTKRSKSVERF